MPSKKPSSSKSKPKSRLAKPAKTVKTAKKPSRGLGRGLAALMEDVRIDEVVAPIDSPIIDTSASDDVSLVVDIADSPDPLKEPQTSVDAKVETKTSPKKTVPTPVKDRPTSPIVKTPPQQQDIKVTSKDPDVNSGITYVEISCLVRNPEQPRRHFDSQQLNELSESIRKKGVLQPILVRLIPERTYRNKPMYQIVAGERRWQAAGQAGLDTMPVFIREITDEEALEIGVIENVHRADLNPMEEALAYKALTTQFNRTQEEVAQAVGKSRTYITNMMRLLTLPTTVQGHLAENLLTIGHARAIIAAPDPEELSEIIIAQKLSVRDAEDWVRRIKKQDGDKQASVPKSEKHADIRKLENQIADTIGLKADLRHKGPHGELRIRYKSMEQLDELVKQLIG